MLKEASLSGLESKFFAEERGYVPPESNVVAPSVLARVFADKPLPFATNSDGSVDMATYMQWLSVEWVAGMAAFEEQSVLEPSNTTFQPVG